MFVLGALYTRKRAARARPPILAGKRTIPTLRPRFGPQSAPRADHGPPTLSAREVPLAAWQLAIAVTPQCGPTAVVRLGIAINAAQRPERPQPATLVAGAAPPTAAAVVLDTRAVNRPDTPGNRMAVRLCRPLCLLVETANARPRVGTVKNMASAST